MMQSERKTPERAGRKSPGRKPLPVSQRQHEMIRERVREDVKQDYADLGGKALLLEAVKMAKRNLRPGRQVIATVLLSDDQGVLVDTVKVDVTACVLVMGLQNALEVKDKCQSTVSCIRASEAMAKLRQEWKGLMHIQVEQSIQAYFA